MHYHGYTWFYMVAHGLHGIHGCTWSYVTSQGNAWQQRAIHGSPQAYLRVLQISRVAHVVECHQLRVTEGRK